MTDADEECAKTLKNSYFLHYHSQHRNLYRWLYNFAKNILLPRILLPQIVKFARVRCGKLSHDVQNACRRDIMMGLDHRTLAAHVSLTQLGSMRMGIKWGAHTFVCMSVAWPISGNGKRKHRPTDQQIAQ